MPNRGVFYVACGRKAGKLIGAATYWASGAEIDNTAEDAKVFGMEPPGKKSAKDFAVIPSAWPAVVMFLRAQTQWRISTGSVIGLDYNAVRWLFDLYEVEDPPALLDDLQIIEATVVKILSEREK